MELEIHWAGEVSQPVGRLYQDSRGTVFFEYDERWRAGRRELKRLGESQGVRRVDDSIDQVLHALEAWDQIANNLGLPKSITARVGQQHGLAE